MYETRLAGSGVPPAAPRGPSGAPCSSTRRARPVLHSVRCSCLARVALTYEGGSLGVPGARRVPSKHPATAMSPRDGLPGAAACSSTVPRKGPAEQPAAPRIQPAGFHTPSAHVQTRPRTGTGPGRPPARTESVAGDRPPQPRLRRARQIFLGRPEPSTRSTTMVGDCLQALAAKSTLRSENSPPARSASSKRRPRARIRRQEAHHGCSHAVEGRFHI